MLQVEVLGRPRKLFYGWVIVAAAFVGQAFQAGLGHQALGAFLVPLEQSFGWSKTQLAGARSASAIESGMLGPLQGYMVDKLGSRLTMAVGMLVLGLGFIVLGTVSRLWGYYVAVILISVGSTLAGFLTSTTAVNHWFRRKRTLAFSISQMGIGAGGILLVPAVTFVMTAFDWRAAAFAAGVAAWVIGIPTSLLLRQSPERYGLLPDGDLPGVPGQAIPGEAGPGKGNEVSPVPHGKGSKAGAPVALDFTLREALRTRGFWLLAIGHGLTGGLLLSSTGVHQFAHMEQGVGLSRASAAMVVTIMSSMSLGGWGVAAVIGDRVDKRGLAAAASAAMGVSVIMFATAQSMSQAVLAAAILGCTWGLRAPMISAIRGDYFGRSAYGKITGFASIVVTIGAFVGPLMAGWMADTQGSYRLAFVLIGLVGGGGGALAFAFLKPPQPPARLRARGAPGFAAS